MDVIALSQGLMTVVVSVLRIGSPCTSTGRADGSLRMAFAAAMSSW